MFERLKDVIERIRIQHEYDRCYGMMEGAGISTFGNCRGQYKYDECGNETLCDSCKACPYYCDCK